MLNKQTGKAATFKELELTGWNQKANDYHQIIGDVTRQAASVMLANADIDQTTRLLDIATGPGYVAGLATAQGASATGIDFANNMVSLAKQNYPEVDFITGDAEALNFADNSFTVITCAFGMLHLSAPEQAMTEALRVLEPGGRYLYTVWDTPARHEYFNLVLTAIDQYGSQDIDLPPAPPFFRFSDPAESTQALHEAGFSDIEITQIPIHWYPKQAQDLLSLLEKSSVRAALLLEGQPPDVQEQIKQAILSGAEKFKQKEGYQLAWPAILVKAIKPSKGNQASTLY